MKRYVIACCLSACLGAAGALWLTANPSITHVLAQETPRRLVPGASEPRGREGRFAAPPPAATPDASWNEFTAEELVNISVYEKANQGVVHITTRASVPGAFFLAEVPSEGAGSGSVLDASGHVLTNYHVVEGANQIRVTLYDGQSYDAGIVGFDAANDIAVLRVEAPADSLHPVELGDSTGLRVGQRVFAIGNPFGLERTLTVGTLSSLNRQLPSKTGRDMKSIIQIDAALNRGNSGGPLLNSRGVLIGMNTAIASSTGENTGVGFAIPVNTIKRVVPQLIQHGRVIRPVIGIASVFETDQGLVIIKLAPGGPAERAGLRGFRVIRKTQTRGPFVYETQQIDRDYADTILAVDGKQVKNGDELLDIVEAKRPGDTVVLRVIREGREVDVRVTLGASE